LHPAYWFFVLHISGGKSERGERKGMTEIKWDGIAEIRTEYSEDRVNDLLSIGWKLLQVNTIPKYEDVGFFRIRSIQAGTQTEFLIGRPKEIPAQEENESSSEYIKRLRRNHG
jgi:hypothetical protein